MRALASVVSREDPGVLAICEIEPGDALSLATRFALQWAYRGRQALFWNDAFAANRVRDEYLPGGRRGFLRIEATYDSQPCMLMTTQIAQRRDARILQLRYARTRLREAPNDALLFVHLANRAVAFEDLGFRDVTPQHETPERLYLRGFEGRVISPVVVTV